MYASDPFLQYSASKEDSRGDKEIRRIDTLKKVYGYGSHALKNLKVEVHLRQSSKNFRSNHQGSDGSPPADKRYRKADSNSPAKENNGVMTSKFGGVNMLKEPLAPPKPARSLSSKKAVKTLRE